MKKIKNYVGMTINANYFRGMEAVGGQIIFDELGFVFKSHSVNIQTGETRIEYLEIKDLQKVNTLGIIPNGMLLLTNDNIEHRFVIRNREKVIRFLRTLF
ncbi:MAG: hypothetical protein R3Y53_01760 [Bacillota bacterium]